MLHQVDVAKVGILDSFIAELRIFLFDSLEVVLSETSENDRIITG